MKPKFFLRQMAKMAVQHLLLPLCYNVNRHRKVDRSLVLFADAHHDSIPESMQALYAFLQREHDSGSSDLSPEGFFRDFGKLSAGETLRTSIAFMKRYATAGTVVLCDNFLPVSACRKRRETKVLQLWHAAGAFKKFGYDAKDDIPPYYKGNVFANYDLVTVSSTRCIRPFQSAMRQEDGVVKALGICRTDAFFDEAALQSQREAFTKHYPDAAGKQVILWAPTFRGNAGVPKLSGLSEMEAAAAALGDDYYLIISLHPHLLTYADYAAYKQPLTTGELLPCADLVITDYSSILYDAALLDKKLLLFTPDRESYDTQRGFYMAPSEIPTRSVSDPAALPEAIRETLQHYDTQGARAFREDWLSACDGAVCSRLFQVLKDWEKENAG